MSTPDKNGNVKAIEGCDRCYCGSKYWENDKCADCDTSINTLLADAFWLAANR